MAASPPDLVLVDQTIGGGARWTDSRGGSGIASRWWLRDNGAVETMNKEWRITVAAPGTRRGTAGARPGTGAPPVAARDQDLAAAPGGTLSVPGVIGDAPAMQRLFKAMAQIAVVPGNVLITGEAGSGKALIAGAIHARSRTRTAGQAHGGRRGGGALAWPPAAAACSSRRLRTCHRCSQLQLVRLLEQQDATGRGRAGERCADPRGDRPRPRTPRWAGAGSGGISSNV